jgi:hypothetical protein
MFRENSHAGGRGTLDNPLESGTLQKRALYQEFSHKLAVAATVTSHLVRCSKASSVAPYCSLQYFYGFWETMYG